MAGIGLGPFDATGRIDNVSGRSIMTISKITRRLRLSAISAALAVSFGAATPPVFAGKLSCKADIFVKNRKAASIKVLRFQYIPEGKTDWETEALDNKRLAPNEEEEWHSVNLQNVASGVAIMKTRVEFKDDNSGAGDGYGPAKWSGVQEHTSGYKCLDGRNYAHYIDTGE